MGWGRYGERREEIREEREWQYAKRVIKQEGTMTRSVLSPAAVTEGNVHLLKSIKWAHKL